jgi:hypothetical protein
MSLNWSYSYKIDGATYRTTSRSVVQILVTGIDRLSPSHTGSRWNWKSKIPQSSTSASYLDVLLKLDTNGKITTQLYDKRDDFNFSIVNFPYLCGNSPASPAYGVYISQLIRYARACSTYDQFLVRGNLLTDKLMSQGFQLSRLQAAFHKFYGRYNDLICPYNLYLDHMLSDMFHTNR